LKTGVTDFVVGAPVNVQKCVHECHLGEINFPHSALLRSFRNPGYPSWLQWLGFTLEDREVVVRFSVEDFLLPEVV